MPLGKASQRRRLRYLALSLAIVMGPAACSGARGRTPAAPPSILDTFDLLAALEESGIQVSELSESAVPGFGVPGRVFRLVDAEVHVYEYPNATARREIASEIAAAGEQRLGDQANLWATGRLIVLYSGTDGGTILLLSGLLGDPLTRPDVAQDEPYPPAVLAALGALAQELEQDPASFEVLRYGPENWPDGCLGLPRPGEQCAEAITPGWNIELRARGMLYVYHTDQLGIEVRRR